MDSKDAKLVYLEKENRRMIKKVQSLEKRISIIDSIPQLIATASNSDIILAVNKITNSIKRKL